jgi:hypothetical protein
VTNVDEPSDDDGPPPAWLIIAGIVGALTLVFLLGAGFGQGWGANQWGPVAAWLSGAATLAAVVVALRQASIALRQSRDAQREARRGQVDRLVDHEVSRRRECIDALSQLWGALVGMGIEFLTFTQYLDGVAPQFDPNQQRTPSGVRGGQTYGDEIVQHITDFAEKFTTRIQPPLFRAVLVLHGTPLESAVNQITAGNKTIGDNGIPSVTSPIMQGRRPNTARITTMWHDLLRLRDGHLKLGLEHFSLAPEDVEEYVRQHWKH